MPILGSYICKWKWFVVESWSLVIVFLFLFLFFLFIYFFYSVNADRLAVQQRAVRLMCAVTPQEVGRYTSHHKAWKSGDFRVAKRLADVSIPDV